MHSILALLSGCVLAVEAAKSTVPNELFSPLVPQKVLATFKALPIPTKYPQYTTTSGTWQYFSPDTWTSGFFPVTGYELNTRKNLCPATPANGLGIADWLAVGRAASNGLIPLENGNGQGHDQGFLSFPFVEELIVNPNNETAKTAILAFSKILADRFNPVVGATRSWNTADPTDFQVIIDNMMNLELLFHAETLTGNSTLRKIAIAHADTTMKNHIRPDGSTWHVIEYNSTTGAVIKKRTAQGFSDSSTWSRGQAWGIYGFANMFRLTGDSNYLVTARRLATYFLANIPSDGIVPWDFNAPLIPAPRPADSSAATIAANALLLLAKYETTASATSLYTNAAIAILNNITRLAWNPSWQSILSNGTVNKPANNQLTGTVYGDYYFIKAGNELINRKLATCT
ncbi:glycoside hydrolase family 88 protein [Lyophyllum atratum]|nr:glycoside hydrolase family 88 protein [Lyophyllum atratum]